MSSPGSHHYITTGRSENNSASPLIVRARLRSRRAPAAHHDSRRADAHRLADHGGDAFCRAIAKITPLVLELKKAYGIEFFSIGGGLGIRLRVVARERQR